MLFAALLLSLVLIFSGGCLLEKKGYICFNNLKPKIFIHEVGTKKCDDFSEFAQWIAAYLQLA